MVYDFEKLIKLAESKELNDKIVEGFISRHKERERVFEEKVRLSEPTSEWYERRYTI